MGFHIKIKGETSPEHGEGASNFQCKYGNVPTFKFSGQVARLNVWMVHTQQTTEALTPKRWSTEISMIKGVLMNSKINGTGNLLPRRCVASYLFQLSICWHSSPLFFCELATAVLQLHRLPLQCLDNCNAKLQGNVSSLNCNQHTMRSHPSQRHAFHQLFVIYLM